jgi:hypothetical protein
MSYQELDQLMLRLEVPSEDNRKLISCLNHLGSYYGKARQCSGYIIMRSSSATNWEVGVM